MRIAFFGSSLVSAYWNGAATYYRGLLKALAEQGRRTILARHTCAHRVDELLAIYAELGPPQAQPAAIHT